MAANFNQTPANASLLDWRTLQPTITLWLSCMLLLCFCGTILSVILLLMFLIKESLRNAVGFLTANYLFSNLLMVSVNMPIYCFSVYYSVAHHTKISFCQHTYYLFMVNTHSIYYSWFFIALHQMIAVFFPFAFRQLASFKIVAGKIILTWLIPLLINIPIRLGHGGVYTNSAPFGACMVRPSAKSPYPNILAVIGVFVPSACVQAVYLAILIKFMVLRVARRRVWSVTVISSGRGRLATVENQATVRDRVVNRSSVALHPALIRMIVSFLYASCFVIFMLTRLYDRKDFLATPVLELWIMAFFIAPYVLSLVILAGFFRDFNGKRKLFGLEICRIKRSSKRTAP